MRIRAASNDSGSCSLLERPQLLEQLAELGRGPKIVRDAIDGRPLLGARLRAVVGHLRLLVPREQRPTPSRGRRSRPDGAEARRSGRSPAVHRGRVPAGPDRASVPTGKPDRTRQGEEPTAAEQRRPGEEAAPVGAERPRDDDALVAGRRRLEHPGREAAEDGDPARPSGFDGRAPGSRARPRRTAPSRRTAATARPTVPSPTGVGRSRSPSPSRDPVPQTKQPGNGWFGSSACRRGDPFRFGERDRLAGGSSSSSAARASTTSASPVEHAHGVASRSTRSVTSSGGGSRSVTSTASASRSSATRPQVYPPFPDAAGPRKRRSMTMESAMTSSKAPRVGLEPTTLRLTAGCSAN